MTRLEKIINKFSANKKLSALSAVVSRALLMSRLGQQYGTSRDLYEALGYKTEPDYKDYAAYYSRHDLAKAIIDRPVDATWNGGVKILETGDDKDTPLEKAWDELWLRLNLNRIFVRLDKLVSLGEYAVLLLGFDDVKTADDYAKPLTGNKRKLMYVRPFGQENAEIKTYEQNAGDSRYGFPTLYAITTTNVATGTSSTVSVHHSRVLHVVGETLESDIKGIPSLEVVFNRLMDIEKIVGGSAEMFWRGARPGIVGSVEKDYKLTQSTKDGLQDQLDEWSHNLRRFLINEGIDLKTLDQQIVDPSSHIDVQLQMISAVTKIPKRILVGSERGELASSQDTDAWREVVTSRRENYADPCVVTPFVNKCIEHGVLPKATTGRFVSEWSDLFAPSEKERAEVGKTRSEALRNYELSVIGQDVVPPDAVGDILLGLDGDQTELLKEMREAAQAEENNDLAPVEGD